MEPADQDLYNQKLNELIHDEDKIVTCASAALDLKVSIRDAKTLISEFVQDHRQLKPDELAVTYVVSGILKDTKSLGVCLVKETELDVKKELFETVITQLIYSVQKSKNVDFHTIALADKNEKERPDAVLLGSITSKNCVKRLIKVKKLPPPQQKTVKEKPSFFTKPPPKSDNKPNEEKQSTSKEVPSKSQTKPKPTGGIASFFTKGPLKEIAKKNGNSVTVANKINNGGDVAVTNKINGNKEDSVDKNKQPNGQTKASDDEMVIENSFQEEKMEVEEESKSPAKRVSSESVNKKRKKGSKSKDAPNKRRKRIQEIRDSDSDDIFEKEEEDDIIEKSDEEPEPPAVTQTAFVPKNKKRKAIDQTYTDEDGYVVTKTEYVFESASEDEKEVAKKEEIVVKTEEKPIKLPSQKKSTTDSENDAKGAAKKGKKNNKKPPSGKQPSIMSFFKKA